MAAVAMMIGWDTDHGTDHSVDDRMEAQVTRTAGMACPVSLAVNRMKQDESQWCMNVSEVGLTGRLVDVPG